MQHHCWDAVQAQQVYFKLVWRNYHPRWSNVKRGKTKRKKKNLHLTSLSPSVSSSKSRMVLKCSSQTPRLSSLVIFSSSRRAPFRSSTRSLWLESSFRRSATKSEWSMGTSRTNGSKSFGEMGNKIKGVKITNPLQNRVHVTRATPCPKKAPVKRIWLTHNLTWVHNTAHDSADGS